MSTITRISPTAITVKMPFVKQAATTSSTAARYAKMNEQWLDFLTRFNVSNENKYKEETFCNYFSYLHSIEKTNLWQYHSALNTLLLQDIKKDLKRFDGYTLIKKTIKGLVKTNSEPQKADVLSAEIVATILSEYPENHENYEIQQKLFFVLTQFCAFRVDDAMQMTFHNICVTNDKIVIKLDDSKTGRVQFVLKQNEKCPKICPVRIFMVYWSRICAIEPKPQDARFWLTPSMKRLQNDTKQVSYAFSKPVGVNTIRLWFKKILSKFIDILPADVQEECRTGVRSATRSSLTNDRIGLERFTGHSGRRTSATVLAGIEQITPLELQKLGRWKNMSTVQEYVDKKTVEKVQEKINNFYTGIVKEQVPEETKPVAQVPAEKHKAETKDEDIELQPQAKRQLIFKNCVFNGSVTIK